VELSLLTILMLALDEASGQLLTLAALLPGKSLWSQFIGRLIGSQSHGHFFLAEKWTMIPLIFQPIAQMLCQLPLTSYII